MSITAEAETAAIAKIIPKSEFPVAGEVFEVSLFSEEVPLSLSFSPFSVAVSMRAYGLKWSVQNAR